MGPAHTDARGGGEPKKKKKKKKEGEECPRRRAPAFDGDDYPVTIIKGQANKRPG